jgi:hypothetical protein
LIGFRAQDFRRPGDDGRALRIGFLFPAPVTLRGGGELCLKLFIRQLIEAFYELPGGRIEALIGHASIPSWQARRAADFPPNSQKKNFPLRPENAAHRGGRAFGARCGL